MPLKSGNFSLDGNVYLKWVIVAISHVSFLLYKIMVFLDAEFAWDSSEKYLPSTVIYIFLPSGESFLKSMLSIAKRKEVPYSMHNI